MIVMLISELEKSICNELITCNELKKSFVNKKNNS